MKRLCTCLLIALCFILAQAQQLTTLQGRVYLNDTVPAAYATIYLPQHGIGTITDEQGFYLLDNIPAGPSVTLEYAFLGYQTEQFKADLSLPNHRYAHDHRLKEQAILLREVYLTPNGEDPCLYILRKTHEQGQLNRQRLISYTAVCDGNFHVQNMDILMEILPDFAKMMVHGVLRSAGINALFNYLTGSEKVDASYQYTQTWNKGKAKNSEMTILSSSPKMPDQVRQQLKKFQTEDFYQVFYSSKFDAKKVAKRGWTLKGAIEENGRTIDVLTRTEGDSIQSEHTLYIIEDLWAVLRYEMRSPRGSIMRFECHDIGSGIYLPVLFVTNPIPLDLNQFFDEWKKQYEEEKAQDKPSRTEKKILQRYEKVAAERSSVSINLVTPYSIKYNNVVIKE